jgi:lambda family phage portal protein
MWPFKQPHLRTYSVPLRAAENVANLPPWRFSYQTGDKWDGGFGATEFLLADYWTLRARSVQLYETNLYARGLIRRLVTNEINTGLHLEACPIESILGLKEDSLGDWTEEVENRFSIWESEATICDVQERCSFGALQAAARAEALVSGDVLVVLQQDQRTGLPRVRLVSGAAVRTPIEYLPGPGNKIEQGVEIDALGRHVAFWIAQRSQNGLGSMESKRLPAYGEKSGRRLAWLVYGTDRKLDDVRGKPLLALVLQSLREIDRYRDATQRKAVILSMLALFIKKGVDKPGTRPIAGGAVRRGLESTVAGDNKIRKFDVAEHMPGWSIDELQTGEEPQAFSVQGTTETFGAFEEALLQSIAWTHEIPPEVLMQSFNANYSASKAALSEFQMYLTKARTAFGEQFCQPIYEEWLVAEVLAGRVQADGLLDAWRDARQFDIFGAWKAADWSGNIKPALDLPKMVGGYVAMAEAGAITRDRMARELTGTKFSQNVKRLLRENEELARAMAPIAALIALEKGQPKPSASDELDDQVQPLARPRLLVG